MVVSGGGKGRPSFDRIHPQPSVPVGCADTLRYNLRKTVRAMAFLNGDTPGSSEITDLLRGHGISATLQRVQIAQLMFTRPQHLCAEQVLDNVNQSRPAVSKATVYNTLRLFAAKGLVREIIADPTKVFYEPKTNGHHHYFDVDSGELTDIAPGAVVVSGVTVPAGRRLLGVDVVIRIGSA
jgi:Fur family iron response transcriptional regulator